MAHHHDTHDQGGGFWGIATIILGIGFAGFALFTSIVLIIGGIRASLGIQAPAAPAAAPAAPQAAAPAPAAAAAPATGGDA
ncbi:MAG: hypothetical protein ACOYMN_05990, partial [Roseimicrobium sp.]